MPEWVIDFLIILMAALVFTPLGIWLVVQGVRVIRYHGRQEGPKHTAFKIVIFKGNSLDLKAPGGYLLVVFGLICLVISLLVIFKLRELEHVKRDAAILNQKYVALNDSYENLKRQAEIDYAVHLADQAKIGDLLRAKNQQIRQPNEQLETPSQNRQVMIHQALRDLRQMDPQERRQFLESDRVKNTFSEQERDILNRLFAISPTEGVANLHGLGAKFEERCQQLKEEKERIQQAAQSPTATPERKERAAKASAELDKVITAAEAILKDPALKTSPEKQEAAYANVQSALVYGNALVLEAHSGLGVPPSSAIEQTVKSHLDDYTMKVSRGFDGSRTNSNDVSVPNVGIGTRFFGLGEIGSEAAVNANYAPTTPQAAEQEVRTFGGVLGQHSCWKIESAGGGGIQVGFINDRITI